MSFMSNPGDLKPTLKLKRVRWPPNLLTPMRALVPFSDVRVGSKLQILSHPGAASSGGCSPEDA